MEEFNRDLDWLKFEGQVIYEDYIKHIIYIQDNEEREKIIKAIFRDDVLHHFYVLCMSIDNVYNYVEIKNVLPSPFNKYILELYKNSKDNLKDVMRGDIVKYVLFFKNYIASYEYVIKNLDN